MDNMTPQDLLDISIPHETAASLLADKGFNDPVKAVRNIRMLAEYGGADFSEILPPFLNALSSSPDPDLSLNNWERYASSFDDKAVFFAALKENHGLFWPFSLLMGSSQFLATWLCTIPEASLTLINDPAFLASFPEKAQLLDELRGQLEGLGPDASMPVLRRFKKRKTLRIALRDLLGKADLDDTTASIAQLADVLLQGGYEVCHREMVARHGRPLYTDDDGTVRESGFVVIGMGKLGGAELNFSSDIDPIYVYTSEKGETTGAGDSGDNSTSNHQFFIKLGELLTKVINSVTEDGFVYRVDLRLRPEGQRGDITSSLRSHEVYYEAWGETWERAAMIKARPVAGDMELGSGFLSMIRPFVYRKYLDYSAIEEIRAMKERIDRHELAKGRKGLDVKLGRGGIREIEFFIQALQLLYGGRVPGIRERKSLKALHKLTQKGLISYDEYSDLAAAYRFLRTAEHRLQLFNDRQVHTLPSDARELEVFSRRMGYRPRKGESASELFMKDYRQHTERVRGIFEDLFKSARHEESERDGFAALLDPELTFEEIRDTLVKLGFADPLKAYRNMMLLRDGDPFSHQTPRSRKTLYELFTHLMETLKRLPDPDQALNNFEAFISGMGARGTLYALLCDNPIILEPILTLFSDSEYLSRILISRPEIVEPMLRFNLAVPFRSRKGLVTELGAMMAGLQDTASRIDIIRRFKHLEEIRLGLRDLMGDARFQETTQGLTRLAEACVEEAIRLAWDETSERYGLPSSGNFCVAGLGKFGGRELSYGSDLDVIFLYDGDGETTGGNAGAVGYQEFYSRVANRLISHLSTMTREGIAYRIDARLRPGGSKGPLATSIETMARYFHDPGGADVWERQALLKARVVAGSNEMREPLRCLIRESAALTADLPELGIKISQMRKRMEDELGRKQEEYNIKTGHGGIVDVEFLAQYLQLRHGKEFPAIIVPSTLHTARLAGKYGLLHHDDMKALTSGYLFLRRLESKIRITGLTTSCLPAGSTKKMQVLARRLDYAGMDGPDRLLAEYLGTTDIIREIFEKVVR